MATYLSEDILYKNGQIKEVINNRLLGTDIRIKANGAGSYQLIGKLNINDEPKVINLINLSDYSITNTASDDNIYIADITGLYSISVQNVEGFDSINCIITYAETYLCTNPMNVDIVNKLDTNSDGQLTYDDKVIGYSENDVGQKSANGLCAEIFNDYENNVASGDYSHAEGTRTQATKQFAHVEGCQTTASGDSAHAEGLCTIASGCGAHVEGNNGTASGTGAHTEGNGTIASGIVSHSEGSGSKAIGVCAHAEGDITQAIGNGAHAEGNMTQAIGDYSHAEGCSTRAIGYRSHAEGGSTKASYYCHSEGYATIADGYYSHSEGYITKATTDFAHAGGYYTIANKYQTAIGRGNIDTSAPSSASDTAGSLLIIGNGTSDTDRSNAFRVATDGSVYGCGEYSSSGADYAEMFEWLDGNERNEDRRGLFVTLDGDKIKLANADDYILGVISVNPSVVGDAQSEQWQGKYLKDVFGCNVTKETAVVDENGKETDKVSISYELNPDYNSECEYISREYRKEWATVGLIGKLVVVDDGTCTVNGYCMPKNGIATKSETGYRVMKRLDDTHISIILK